jgi:dihydrofolate reductase
VARIVYSMMVSLDGYITRPDGDIGLPVPEGGLHRHFNDMMQQTSIELCGRRMYEVMRFWDSPGLCPRLAEDPEDRVFDDASRGRAQCPADERQC